MPRNNLAALTSAIQKAYGCESLWIRTSQITQAHEGELAWEGSVETFALSGHPTALLCYAWSRVAGSELEHVIILHGLAVSSPSDAVRSYMTDHRMDRLK
jgi:hypothetical protein